MGKTIFEYIVSDARKNVFQAVRSAAQEIGDDIEQAFEDVIQAFYDDYSPTWYRRTDSLWYASSSYGNGFLRRNSSDIVPTLRGDSGNTISYEVGIKVSGSNYGFNPYVRFNGDRPSWLTPDWVFDRAFYKGIHGFSQGSVWKHNKGMSKDSYWRPVTVPHRMSPTPETLMNRKFKQIEKSVESKIANALK